MRYTFTLGLALLHLLPLVAQIDFRPVELGIGGDRIRGVDVHDLNGDGYDDLLVAFGSFNDPPFENSLMVLYQDSTGRLENFMPTVFYPFTGHDFTVVDLNGDQRLDLALATSDSLLIAYQSAQGTFDSLERIYSGGVAESLVWGHFNQDGRPDLAVCTWITTGIHSEVKIRVLYRQDSGWADSMYAAHWTAGDYFAVGDLTGDGLDDLVFGGDSEPNSTLLIYPQLDSGGLGPPLSPLSLSGTIHDLALLDADRDGFLDLILSYRDESDGRITELHVYPQDTTAQGILLPPQYLPTFQGGNHGRLATQDLNCDGFEELILNYGAFGLSVYEADSLGKYGAFEHFDWDNFGIREGDYTFQPMGVGDLNSDGRIDLAGVPYGITAEVHILYNRTAPDTFTRIDTTLDYDTVTVEPVYVPYGYADTTVIATWGDSMYVSIDSFVRRDTYRMDSLRTDTILVRQGEFCGGPFQDTVVRSSMRWLSGTLLSTGRPNRAGRRWLYLPLTSSPDRAEAHPLRLYPNPTEGTLHLEWSGDPPPGAIQVSLQDPWGRRLWQGTWREASLELDLTPYPSGVYLLRLQGPEGQTHRRVWRR